MVSKRKKSKKIVDSDLIQSGNITLNANTDLLSSSIKKFDDLCSSIDHFLVYVSFIDYLLNTN